MTTTTKTFWLDGCEFEVIEAAELAASFDPPAPLFDPNLAGRTISILMALVALIVYYL